MIEAIAIIVLAATSITLGALLVVERQSRAKEAARATEAWAKAVECMERAAREQGVLKQKGMTICRVPPDQVAMILEGMRKRPEEEEGGAKKSEDVFTRQRRVWNKHGNRNA